MDLSKLNRLDCDELYVTDKHAFFYGSWASNFYRAPFKWSAYGEEHEFFCTEQAFMWAKAMTFGDTQTAKDILEEKSSPMACKMLGRKVKNYVDSIWNMLRLGVMYEVNVAKFSQNEDLRMKITDEKFNGKTFVEASPSDPIWGIMMPIGDPNIDDETNWKGQNLLGKALTSVREELLKGGQKK